MKITKLEHIKSENTILLCLFTARSTVNIRIFPVNFYFELSILKSVTEAILGSPCIEKLMMSLKIMSLNLKYVKLILYKVSSWRYDGGGYTALFSF